MSSYYIESKAGVIFGIYEGDTPEGAFAAMVADAGDGVDTDGSSTAGTADDWIIIDVIDVDQDWEHEATIYSLENGAALVESGPHKRYYETLEAAREALYTA